MRRIKFIKQHDSMQCGAACRAMICDMYGKSYPLEKISNMVSVSRSGVSMYAIKEAGAKLGFSSKCQLMSIEQLCEIKKPAIIHWNQNHFVILHRISNNKYFHVIELSWNKTISPAFGCRTGGGAY